MRLRILLGLSAIALLSMLIGSAGYGQFGGGGGKGFGGGGRGFGGGGGRGRMKLDPNQIFDFMSRGQPYLLISNMRGSTQGPMMEYAQAKGITDGKLTREQFVGFNEYMKAKMAGGGTTPGAPGTPGAQPPASTDTLNQWADNDFKQHDTNGDGKLNVDEMPGSLRQGLAQWDTNKDGLIDQTEYRGYYVTRYQERMARAGAGATATPVAALVEEDLDKRPVVFRAGKLPEKGLPTWFKQLDTDADGQVALYEWHQGGKELSEFTEWDRDDDGYITPEEALHVNAVLTKTADPLAPGGSLSVTSSSGGTPPSAFKTNGFGGGKGFGGGRGFGGGKGFGGGGKGFGGGGKSKWNKGG